MPKFNITVTKDTGEEETVMGLHAATEAEALMVAVQWFEPGDAPETEYRYVAVVEKPTD